MKNSSIDKFQSWVDNYLNFEKTPKKNIFWLDTMNFFCEKFGHPEKSAPAIHVAGSKGKGSVSTMICSILQEAGLSAGLYTSPHILDFVERIGTCRGPFSNDVYDTTVSEIISGVDSINAQELPGNRPITWFELVTLFGFLCFRAAKTDWNVFEVGLGGRLDATNVIAPKVCCITPLELEHTEFLGDTIEKIAFEKGGIIKEGVPVISAPQCDEARQVLKKIAEERNAKIFFIDELFENISFSIKKYTKEECDSIKKNTSGMKIELISSVFSRPIKTTLKLMGKVQAYNAAMAAFAVKTALPQISEETIEHGLSKAFLPGRFEIIENLELKTDSVKLPVLVLDGAHTPNSVSLTMDTFRNLFENQKASLLFACASDKDMDDMAPLFKDTFEKVFLTRPGDVKQSDISRLEDAFSKAGIHFDSNPDYIEQIKKALKYSSEHNEILLVTGSFYLVSEVKKFLM